MSGNIIWKLLLTAALLAWSLANILPTQDTPFETYLVEQVGEDEAAFMAILEDAREQVAAGDEASVFTALRTLGETGEVDLARFFPDINLIDVKNVKRRNEIVLKELYNRSRGNVRLGLDLKGGVSVTFAIDDEDLREKPDYVRDEELDKAVRIMRNRLDATGVAEPVIRVKGENSLEVQLPGLSTKDNPEVIDRLKKPARLEFRLVNRDPSVVPPDMAVSEYPPGYEVLNLEREDPRTGEITEIPYFVKRIPEATGAIVEEANPVQNQSGGYEVAIDFTSEGSEIFYNITNGIRQQNRPEANDIGQLAIVLDGQLESAPTVNIALRNSASITGDFSQRQAIELSNVLNNPLDVPLRVTEMYEVGPSLAADARESSIKAAQLGAVLVVIFMIAFYWFGGVVAVLAGIINILIVLGVLSSLGATLTLPGGSLEMEWYGHEDDPAHPVRMTGGVAYVFSGEYPTWPARENVA
jgi:SecD/SecF fusion protein